MSLSHPTAVAERIEDMLAELEELVTQAREAGREHAIAEAIYKTAFAKSRLRYRAEHAKPTVDSVNDHATVETADDMRRALFAETHLQVTRDALRATQARLDALRTLSASFRMAGG